MKESGQTESIEYKQISARSQALRTAQTLAIPLNKALKHAQLVNFWKIIENQQEDMPAAHQAGATEIYAIEMMDAKRVDQWVAAMSVTASEDEVGDEEWDINYPSFRHVLPLKEPADPRKFQFQTHYYNSFLCEGFMKIVLDQRQHGTLRAICDKILDEADAWKAGKDELDSEIIDVGTVDEAVNKCSMVARGFLALVDPRPLYRGSSSTDVNFLFPEKKKKDVPSLSDLGTAARVIANEIQSSTFWKEARGSWKATCAVDDGIAKPFTERCNQMNPKQELTPELLSNIKEVVVLIPEWKKHLRSGAIDELVAWRAAPPGLGSGPREPKRRKKRIFLF